MAAPLETAGFEDTAVGAAADGATAVRVATVVEAIAAFEATAAAFSSKAFWLKSKTSTTRRKEGNEYHCCLRPTFEPRL